MAANLGAAWATVGSLLEQKYADKAQARLIEEESKQITLYNKALAAETARAAGEIRRQQSYETRRTAQALVHTKDTAAGMVAQSNVAEATADRVGASSTAVRSDIARQEDAAIASIWDNNEIMNENTNVAMQTMLNQAKGQFAVPQQRAMADQTLSIFVKGIASAME